VMTIMAVAISTSYGQEPDKKSVTARENLQEAQIEVVDAKWDVKEARMDTISEYQNFRNECEVRIKENKKSIADLRLKASDVEEKDRTVYQENVNKLEQKNFDLNRELADYKDEGLVKWVSFKREFNHDMDELGKALKDFAVDNKM